MLSVVGLDSYSYSREAGRIAGRLIFLAFVPVLLIALVYWLRGRSRPQPMPFTHAISRWWVWVIGLPIGLVLLVLLGLAVAAPSGGTAGGLAFAI